jgi:putative aldouronate transport system permease protein
MSATAAKGIIPTTTSKSGTWHRRVARDYHLMLLPGIVLLLIFNVYPIIGVVMAFERYIPTKGFWGSDWVGLENFQFVLKLPNTRQIFINTIFIALGKIVFSLVASLVFALLLHEVTSTRFKRTSQTIVYMPHFLSWVILAGVVRSVLAEKGPLNQIVGLFTDSEPTLWLVSNTWFRPVLISTHVWKEFGFGAIIFLAALANINPSLYEAAAIDGANRWRRLMDITIPGMLPIITMVAALSIGGILSAGFEQVINLYNPLVYRSGDVIDTWVYRTGLLNAEYSLAAAVGLLQGVVGFILIVISYILAYRYADYRVF